LGPKVKEVKRKRCEKIYVRQNKKNKIALTAV